MSTSVLSMPSYTDRSGGMASTGSTPRSPCTVAPGINNSTTNATATLLLPASSLRNPSAADKPRLLGVPGSGLRISFASDTSFVERKLRTRGSSRSNATSLNLRPMDAGDKPAAVRIKIPKATNAMGSRQIPLLATPLGEDLMHPRRALDIARSYGVPKYFLRGNTQILTDGRMRLFADNVWRQERMSPAQDTPVDNYNTSNGPQTAASRKMDNSDVICRLMESVNKAIATSEKSPRGDQDGAATTSERERSALRDSIVSLPDVLPNVSLKELKEGHLNNTRSGEKTSTGADVSFEADGKTKSTSNIDDKACSSNTGNIHTTEQNEICSSKTTEAQSEDMRPHTVDTSAVPNYLPRVASYRNVSSTANAHAHWTSDISGNDNTTVSQSKQRDTLSSHMAGIRLKSMKRHGGFGESLDSAQYQAYKKSPSNSINNRVGVLFGGKYRNVLPRFYPAVSAHHVRQSEAAAAQMGATGGVRFSVTQAGGTEQRGKAAAGEPRRLVRFSDTTQTVRFSNDSVVASKARTSAIKSFSHRSREQHHDIGHLVASRAPVQSVQRSLDSHSGLSRPEWFKGGRSSTRAGTMPGQRDLTNSNSPTRLFKRVGGRVVPDLVPLTSAVPTTDKPLGAVTETDQRTGKTASVQNVPDVSPTEHKAGADETLHMFELDASVVSPG